jgi:hypothetical protein
LYTADNYHAQYAIFSGGDSARKKTSDADLLVLMSMSSNEPRHQQINLATSHGAAPTNRRTCLRHAQGVGWQYAPPDPHARKIRTELSLAVLAYDMKRVISQIGVGPLLQAIRT